MRVFRLALGMFALTSSVVLFSSGASAQNAETRARGLNRDAMEDDYLATNMKAALAKLQTAVRVCAGGQCTNDLLAQVYANLGIVYSAGLNKHSDAVEAFKQALKLQPTISPDANYLTTAVQKAFDEAKAASGTKTATGERSLAVLQEKPWAEQATYVPVPIFVELPDGVEATRIVVSYKAPGQTGWTELTLKQQADGFGGYIPCAAVQKEGKLQYFVTAFDANLDRVASAGSAKEPRRVQLKKAISGRQPALPGADPPSACPRAVQGLSCETDDDCPGSQVCEELQCVDKDSVHDPDAQAERARKRNWVGLLVAGDFMFIQQNDLPCKGGDDRSGNVDCYFNDRSRYDRTLDADQGSANELTGGIAPVGTLRLMLTYDRVFGKRLVAGIRLGYALLGPPEDFLPLHAEARFAFHFSNDPFANAGVRPYAFVGGGFGPAAGRVPVQVVDASPSVGKDGVLDLDAYQVAGPAFAVLGPGVQYAVNPRLALVLEVGAKVMLPEFALVLAPYLGAAYGF